MISGVKKTIDGRSVEFRMTARAMMAIEESAGKGIVEVLQDFDSDVRIGRLVLLVAECAEGGFGVPIEEGQQLVDDLGVTGAAELIGEVAQSAFPEAAPAKNAKGAARSK